MAAADLLIVSQLKLKMGAKIPQQSSPRHGSLSAVTKYYESYLKTAQQSLRPEPPFLCTPIFS